MPCPICGGEVEQNRHGSRIYCNPQCRVQAAYAVRKKNRTGRQPVDPRTVRAHAKARERTIAAGFKPERTPEEWMQSPGLEQLFRVLCGTPLAVIGYEKWIDRRDLAA